jgi:hypothetical protein
MGEYKPDAIPHLSGKTDIKGILEKVNK